jgi:hypothetical protein
VEQVDLETEATAARKVIEHVLQRSVGHKPAVPILLAVDLHQKTRWQGATGHHVLGTHGDRIVVEKGKAADAHVHRADAEAHCLGVDAIEVDQTLERALEQVCVVVTGWIGERDPVQHRSWREEAGLTEH